MSTWSRFKYRFENIDLFQERFLHNLLNVFIHIYIYCLINVTNLSFKGSKPQYYILNALLV